MRECVCVCIWACMSVCRCVGVWGWNWTWPVRWKKHASVEFHEKNRPFYHATRTNSNNDSNFRNDSFVHIIYIFCMCVFKEKNIFSVLLFFCECRFLLSLLFFVNFRSIALNGMAICVTSTWQTNLAQSVQNFVVFMLNSEIGTIPSMFMCVSVNGFFPPCRIATTHFER